MSDQSGKPSKKPLISLQSKILECIKTYQPISTDRLAVLCGGFVPSEKALRRWEQQKVLRPKVIKYQEDTTLEEKIKIGREQLIMVSLSSLRIRKKIRKLPKEKYKTKSKWEMIPHGPASD